MLDKAARLDILPVASTMCIGFLEVTAKEGGRDGGRPSNAQSPPLPWTNVNTTPHVLPNAIFGDSSPHGSCLCAARKQCARGTRTRQDDAVRVDGKRGETSQKQAYSMHRRGRWGGRGRGRESELLLKSSRGGSMSMGRYRGVHGFEEWARKKMVFACASLRSDFHTLYYLYRQRRAIARLITRNGRASTATLSVKGTVTATILSNGPSAFRQDERPLRSLIIVLGHLCWLSVRIGQRNGWSARNQSR